MADFYKVLKADPLGDPWVPSQPGAKPIQNYWCQVEGQDKDVNIGKQVGNPLTPGQYVYGDLTYAKSQKGTEYWKFKSQQVPEGVQRPADGAAPAQPVSNMSAAMPDWFLPVNNQIRYIYDQMKKMDADFVEPTTEKMPLKTVDDELHGEPVDEETKAKIDDIFNEPVPEDV